MQSVSPATAGAGVTPDHSRPAGQEHHTAWDDRQLWLATILTGVVAGGVGIAITGLLHLVQHVAFGYTENTFLYGVEHASAARRVVVLLLAGIIGGLGWLILARRASVHTVGDALGPARRRLPIISTTLDACLQIVVVGMGASLGREGAPRQVAGALGGVIARRLGVDADGRRLAIAVGAGAGLAAVYNVPLAGALFTVEVLLASTTVRTVAAALVCSGIATAVSWLGLPNAPTYHIAAFPLRAPIVVFVVVICPIAGLAACGFRRLMTWSRAHAARGWWVPVSAVAVFTALGALAIAYPQLLGNGKGATDLAFAGTITGALALVLAVLKPIVTAACLRAGAVGGLLTPTLCTGALLGAAAGHVWASWWPGQPLGSYALIGAVAMLSATQRAPLFAIALVVELTRGGVALLVPLILAAGFAYVCQHVAGELAGTFARRQVSYAASAPIDTAHAIPPSSDVTTLEDVDEHPAAPRHTS